MDEKPQNRESCVPWLLRTPSLFADPIEWYKSRGRKPPEFGTTSSLAGLLANAYPELQDERALYDKLAKDLHNEGLIGMDTLHGMMTANGAFSQRASELGNQLLRFYFRPT
jgi:hypothetical protein